MRITLTDPPLFFWKTALVFALSFALIPLISMKSEVPALLYAGGLVALHVFVLVVYLYRVRFRDLDPDARSLIARLAALVVVSYLLFATSAFEDGAAFSTLALQMLALSVLHTVVLALLMARVSHRPRPASELAPAAEGNRER